MGWTIFMKLGRTSLEAMSILVLGYHGNTSLTTVARGLNFTENHIISVFISGFVVQTQVKMAYK